MKKLMMISSTLASAIFLMSGCSTMAPYAGEQLAKFPQELNLITCYQGKISPDGSKEVFGLGKWEFYPHENRVLHTKKADLEWRGLEINEYPLKSEYRNLGEGIEEYLLMWNIVGLEPGGNIGTFSFVTGGKRENILSGRTIIIGTGYSVKTLDNSIVCEVKSN